jgi:Protein of unknown function (DUF3592)
VKTDWKATDGTVAEVEERRNRSAVWYSVVFTYKVEGSWYGGTFSTDEAYRKGDLIAVQYDPANPEHNDLVDREKRRNWTIALVLTAVGIIALLVVALSSASRP